MSQRITLAPLLALTTLSACSHQANITTTSGLVEGTIIRSDAEAIYVERSEYQPLTLIKRTDIVDIDHPGNVVATIGAVLAGTHVFIIAIGAVLVASAGNDDYNQFIAAQTLAQGVIVTTVGGGMLWWGYDAWSGSVDAVEGSVDGSRVLVSPTMLLGAQGQPRAGLGVSFTY